MKRRADRNILAVVRASRLEIAEDKVSVERLPCLKFEKARIISAVGILSHSVF